MNDISPIPLLIVATIIIVLFTSFIIAVFIIQKGKQNKAYLEKKQMTLDYQQQVLKVQLEVQEETMNKMSHEIHDNLGQTLTAAMMKLYATLKITNREDANIMIEDTLQSLEEVVGGLRNISHALNTEHIQRIGLWEAIRKELSYIESALSIQCSIEESGTPFPLSKDREIVIFRITQEALANILKHAKATSIKIDIAYTMAAFSLRITDNGTGFDTGAAGSAAGIGFINMRQRAHLLKGTLTVYSQIGKGSSITLEIPRDGNE